MIKEVISRFSVLFVLIALMTACTKQSEYTNAIPANASVVASINLKALAEKSGLNDKENEAVKQKIMDALKSGMTATTFQQLEKVIKNPMESGIDVKSPIYLFTSPTYSTPILIAKVSNEDDLRTSLEVMVKEQLCQPLSEADGFSFTSIEEGLFAFNHSTALLIGYTRNDQIEETKKVITELLKQSSENSITPNNCFQKLLKQKGDINFFASATAISSEYIKQLSMGLSSKINAEDLTLIGGISFEKGKITMSTEYYTENEEAKALLKKQEKAITKVNNTFLKYFPASTLAFMNIGVNGSELYNLLQENEEFRNTVSIAKANEVKTLFSSFNGDISIGLINVTMDNAPTFVAYADVKNGNALKALYEHKQLIGLNKGENILKLNNDEYVYKFKGMNLFFGIKNKLMYATNDELIYKSIGKAADKSIKDAVYASDMKGKNFFMAINMESVLELPVIKMMVGFGGEEYMTYTKLASQISYLAITSKGETNEISLQLKNKDTNALKQIVDFARQFAGM